jgi:alcohol dehydrogenase (cytochrome c)
LDLIYWGTGNPGPDFDDAQRAGDNLYSNSTVALEPATGKLRWHFQYTPRDVNDYDATQVPVLIDRDYRGTPRKLLVTANRNGFYYVLDRTNGQFLSARPFARTTWAERIDENGRPVLTGKERPTAEGNPVCPGLFGATNWMSPSYHPGTGLFFVQVREECMSHIRLEQEYRPGVPFWGGAFRWIPGEKTWGALQALDAVTGEKKWEFRYGLPPWGGTLATAGDLVFATEQGGYLLAFDAGTGAVRWKFHMGAAGIAAPMTYSVDGRQYVAVASGAALFAFALPEEISR